MNKLHPASASAAFNPVPSASTVNWVTGLPAVSKIWTGRIYRWDHDAANGLRETRVKSSERDSFLNEVAYRCYCPHYAIYIISNNIFLIPNYLTQLAVYTRLIIHQNLVTADNGRSKIRLEILTLHNRTHHITSYTAHIAGNIMEIKSGIIRTKELCRIFDRICVDTI